MIAFAEAHFRLAQPDEGGLSHRETLEGLAERTKRPEKRAEYEAQLQTPPLPAALAYLWTAYLRIRRRKGGSGFGPSPIDGGDVESYERRFRFRFTPWEHEMIDALDDAYMMAASERGSD